jgi:hypothetical protein
VPRLNKRYSLHPMKDVLTLFHPNLDEVKTCFMGQREYINKSRASAHLKSDDTTKMPFLLLLCVSKLRKNRWRFELRQNKQIKKSTSAKYIIKRKQ